MAGIISAYPRINFSQLKTILVLHVLTNLYMKRVYALQIYLWRLIKITYTNVALLFWFITILLCSFNNGVYIYFFLI